MQGNYTFLNFINLHVKAQLLALVIFLSVSENEEELREN